MINYQNPSPDKFWKIILKHSSDPKVKRYLELNDELIIKRFKEMAEIDLVREYLDLLDADSVKALTAELRECQTAAPSLSEEDILNFDFPTLIGSGFDARIDAIVHELNKRNLNQQGYGKCVRCDGYHSNKFGEEFCWTKGHTK
jgi:hypothetical protein